MLKKEDFIIVGLGASAGGLEPLQTFVKNIIPSSNLSYVITQHLDPNQDTMLVDILSKISSINVMFIKNEEKILPNTIYVCPPNYNVIIENKHFKLLPPSYKERPIPSINTFFSSLAKEKEDKAVGIILSGIGDDGTEGIKLLKSLGSITIAQDEKTAKYPSMPRAAITSKSVDLVLSPEVMATELEFIISHPLKLQEKDSYQDELNEIFDILHEKTDTDFSDYKLSTIFRRIKRRMIVCKKETLKDYIEYLKVSPKETILLHKELLVIVTSFFRDKEAFSALTEHVQNIISHKNKNESIRIWVTGCATGEEAYSIAIIFNELLKKNNLKNKIQLFATDISSEAIEKARAGIYTPEDIETIDTHIKKTYFTKKDKQYKVAKELRDMIIFSKHDLIQDPPFLNIDLITCRNLLIYFNANLQKRIFSIFFNILDKDGYLFLGKSESTANLTNLFMITDNKWKFFKKDITAKPPTIETMTYYPKRYAEEVTHIKKPTSTLDTNPSHLHDFLAQTILEKYIQNYIIINRENHIIYSKGDLEEYMKFPKGGFTHDIFSFLKESIRVDVRIAVLKARREQEIVNLNIKLNNTTTLLIDTIPIINSNISTEGMCLTFKQIQAPFLNEKQEKNANLLEQYNKHNIQELEQELIETKDRLQSAIEELETSNEELQSTNEELQSSNEELQSTNEELETSNEELQSTNEELITVNQELEDKSETLRIVNKDLENTFNIIEYGVLILDTNFKIRKYTSFMEKVSSIHSSEKEQSIQEINLPIEYQLLKTKIEKVVKTGQTTKFETNYKKLTLWVTIKPYREDDNSIKGSILSFIDISKVKKNEKALTKAKNELEHINKNLEKIVNEKTAQIQLINKNLEEKNRSLHTTLSLFENTFEQAAVGIAHVSPEGKWLRINQKIQTILGYSKEDLEGITFQDITHPDDIDIDLFYIDKMLEGKINNYSIQKRYITKNQTVIWVKLTVSLVYKDDGSADYFISVIEDITKQKEQEELIKKQKKEFESIFRYSKDGIAILTLDSLFLDFNDAYLEMTGFSREELLSKKCIDLTAPEYMEKTQEAFKSVLRNGFFNDLEKVCIVQGGRRVTTIMTLTLMPDKKRILLTTKDITSFKMLEAQAKLASMGEMIGNIAHQWRQPLSIITTSASGLKLRSDYDDNLTNKEIGEFSDHIIDQANYLSKTIDDFRNFIKGSTVFHTIRITDVIENSLALTQATIHNNYIKLIKNIEEDISIRGNINELEQALINIINNAKDAIKENVKNDDEKFIFISTDKLEDDSVILKICDTGGGIPEDLLERIFEPYFTTKHQSVGTGLGLAMSYKIIVERHHQNIVAHNETIKYNEKTFKGACFTITFQNKK